MAAQENHKSNFLCTDGLIKFQFQISIKKVQICPCVCSIIVQLYTMQYESITIFLLANGKEIMKSYNKTIDNQ